MDNKLDDTNAKTAQHGEKNQIVIAGEGRPQDKPGGFRFGRMFPLTKETPLILKLSACSALGDNMTRKAEDDREDSVLPAGYTYFGQFVDHDISFDETDKLPGMEGDDPNTDAVEPTRDEDLVQKRSPALDLDSLYGGGHGDAELLNGPKFKIGKTSPVPGAGQGPVGQALPYDLPRGLETRGSNTARIAAIGDPRNDENLAVAQTHLMWLKFHNAVVDQLSSSDPGASDASLFARARDLVTKHYQHIVLHDFLKRILDTGVYSDIIVAGNRKVLQQCCGEVPFMPLEFSVAAYRYGHSQVREIYDWNLNFGTGAFVLPETPFSLLFEFSQGSGNFGGRGPTLPTNWIADFRRLFDFEDADFPHLKGSVTAAFNRAKMIDPFLAPALGTLPEIEMLVQKKLRPFANLAGLNLRRGSMRALPTGQDVSRELPSVRMLTKAQMRGVIDNDFHNTMETLGLYDRTPLWLYILFEAAILGNGERLGPLGSTIVADTFRTLVLTSRVSILKPGAEWSPAKAQGELGLKRPIDSIPQLLLWLDKKEPIIDPLQDDRLSVSM